MKELDEKRRRTIDELKSQGILHDPNIIKAMSKVPREEFLPPDIRGTLTWIPHYQ